MKNINSKKASIYEKIAKGVMLISMCSLLFIIFYNFASYSFKFEECLLSHIHFNPFNTSLDEASIPQSGEKLVIKDEYYELRKVLKGASTKDKTVILAFLNKAWAAPNSIFDLFLKSFRIGNNTSYLLNHLLVVAVDEAAYVRCQTSVFHCYFLNTNHSSEFSGQANFMSPTYLDMIWTRLAFTHTILSLGYNFLVTDTDVMWLRDPFPYMKPGPDIQVSCDFFHFKEYDMRNLPNVGFMLVRSNNRTVEFYKYWISLRHKYPNSHEQNVLDKIKYGSFIKEVGLRVRFLDTNRFGGLCSLTKDFNKVCTMHANCCVGLDTKIGDLKIILEDWKNYISSNQKANYSQRHHWRVKLFKCNKSFVHHKSKSHKKVAGQKI